MDIGRPPFMTARQNETIEEHEARLAQARKHSRIPAVKKRAKARRQTKEFKAWDAARQRRRNAKWGLWNGAKCRAKRRGRPFEISFDYWKSRYPKDMRCQYCRKKMVRYTGTCPTMDEVVPGLGYVPGNVDCICKRCNTQKSDTPVERVEAFAHRMRMAQKNLSTSGG